MFSDFIYRSQHDNATFELTSASDAEANYSDWTNSAFSAFNSLLRMSPDDFIAKGPWTRGAKAIKELADLFSEAPNADRRSMENVAYAASGVAIAQASSTFQATFKSNAEVISRAAILSYPEGLKVSVSGAARARINKSASALADSFGCHLPDSIGRTPGKEVYFFSEFFCSARK
jgi:hypothetical protein